METAVCCMCGSAKQRELFKKKEKFGITKEFFTVVSCADCGFFYVSPRPLEAEIALFYPETYSWKESTGESSLLSRAINGIEKLYRFHLLKYEVSKVKRFTKIREGRILDVGCGSGDRLLVFRNQGYDAYGVEISSAALYAKEKLNLKVFKGDVSSAGFQDNFFDIITLYNVLEHLHDPRRLLREAKRILKDKGFLVIEVPNTASLQFNIFKKRWAAFDVPRDLSYFSPKHLENLLAQEGFRVENIDYYSSWWHPPTFTLSLFPGLDPQFSWKGSYPFIKSMAARFAWAIITVMIAPVFVFFEAVIKRSALITVYAKKND